MMISLINISGCLKIEPPVKIVMTTYTKHSDETNGALRIATNEPIDCIVIGETDYATKLNLGGYYVVHERDLKAFINAIQERSRR